MWGLISGKNCPVLSKIGLGESSAQMMKWKSSANMCQISALILSEKLRSGALLVQNWCLNIFWHSAVLTLSHLGHCHLFKLGLKIKTLSVAVCDEYSYSYLYLQISVWIFIFIFVFALFCQSAYIFVFKSALFSKQIY